MSPRIPQYEHQVGTVIPNVPTLQGPRAVPDAFGGNVARATQGLAQTGANIGEVLRKHGEEKRRQEQDAFTADLETNFSLNRQDQLFSQDLEKVQINGQDVERPKGIFNQKLKNADGATTRLDAYYSDAIERYVASAPSEEHALKIREELINQWVRDREDVIKHEAREHNGVLINSYQSNLKQQVHDAAGVNNPIDLLTAVNKAKDMQSRINTVSGYDEETAENKLKESAGDIVAKAVNSTLTATGDLEKAKQMLDVAEGDIHPDRYEKINEMLEIGDERITKQAEKIEVQRIIKNQSDRLTKFASGDSSWQDLDEIAKEVREGNLPEKFGAALSDVITAREYGEYRPGQENKNYPAFIEKVYNAGSQEEIQKALVGLLNDHKDIAQDKMAVLINEAIKRGESLPLRSEDESSNYNPQQTGIDIAVKAGLDFGRNNGLTSQEVSDIHQDFMFEVGKGRTPDEANRIAQQKFALRTNPNLANIPIEGKMMIDANGVKALVYPDGSWKEMGTSGGSSISGKSDKKPQGKKEAKPKNGI